MSSTSEWTDEWADEPPPELAAVPGHERGQAPAQPVYSALPAFVADYLAPLYRRPLSKQQRPWCPQWWNHPEAVVRLEALWRAWEALRQEPRFGMSTWLLDHADRHMAVLLDPDGPFHGCSATGGHTVGRLEPLPVEPPPEGLY